MKCEVNSLCMMGNYSICRDEVSSKPYYMLNFGHQDICALLQWDFLYFLSLRSFDDFFLML